MKTIKLKRTITLTTVVSLEVPEHLEEENILDAVADGIELFDVVDSRTDRYDAAHSQDEWEITEEKADIAYTFGELEQAMIEDELLEEGWEG